MELWLRFFDISNIEESAIVCKHVVLSTRIKIFGIKNITPKLDYDRYIVMASLQVTVTYMSSWQFRFVLQTFLSSFWNNRWFRDWGIQYWLRLTPLLTPLANWQQDVCFFVLCSLASKIRQFAVISCGVCLTGCLLITLDVLYSEMPSSLSCLHKYITNMIYCFLSDIVVKEFTCVSIVLMWHFWSRILV